jgi:hypothetical protein
MNMSEQHTPGPWKYQQYDDEVIAPNVVKLEDDGACGDPDCCGSPTYHIHLTPANARLIAAAPELLEALKLVTTMPGFEPDEEYGAKVLAAIAKAEGTKVPA